MFDIRPHRTPEPPAPVCPVRPDRSGRPLLRSGRASNEFRPRRRRADTGTSGWGSGTRGDRERGSGGGDRRDDAGGVRRERGRAGGRRRRGGGARRPRPGHGRAPSWRSPTTPPRPTGIRPACGTGDFVSLALERSHVSLPPAGGDAPALRTGAVLIGTPPLGAGYYRLGSTHVVPVTRGPVDRRAPQRRRGGQGRLGRGHRRADPRPPGRRPRASWSAPRRGAVGLVLRNLAEPSFGPEVIAFGGNRYRLERHARAGRRRLPARRPDAGASTPT